jgi:hypothetical protein
LNRKNLPAIQRRAMGHEYKFATTPHNYAATWVETASPNAMLGGSDRELKSDAKRSQLIGVPS